MITFNALPEAEQLALIDIALHGLRRCELAGQFCGLAVHAVPTVKKLEAKGLCIVIAGCVFPLRHGDWLIGQALRGQKAAVLA